MRPDVIALDLETNGLRWDLPGFEVKSVSIALKKDGEIKAYFYNTSEGMHKIFQRLHDTQAPIIVWNLGFELGVLSTLFPQYNFNYYADAQRYLQLFDSGGDLKQFSLKDTVRRFLPDMGNYEKPIYDWLAEHNPTVKKRELGGLLWTAPLHLLEEYNNADVIATMKLYDIFVKQFKIVEFDPEIDRNVYHHAVKNLVDAKRRGLIVDVPGLEHYVELIKEEVDKLDASFKLKFDKEILAVREVLRKQKQATYKKKIATELPEFNVTSKRHLKYLFIDVLGQIPTFVTPTLQPSFRSAHMGQWQGSEELVNRQKRLIIKAQASAILRKSADDGKLHADVFAVGTNTGRYRSGGGVNLQALGRRDVGYPKQGIKGLMAYFIPREGYMFAGSDAVSGEPSVTTEYTGSILYKYFCFDGIGKTPYWSQGILMIDDIYLAFASASSLGKKSVVDAWNKKWGNEGLSFAAQWLEDAEVIKKYLKKTRQLHKVIALALAYGMWWDISRHTGKSKMQETARDAGFTLSLGECEALYKAYWNMFPEIADYADSCKKYCDKNSNSMMNDFGFRGRCEPRKAFNFYIQSTLSSVMHIFLNELQASCAKVGLEYNYVLTLHDELLAEIPIGSEQLYIQAKQVAEDRVNEILQWKLVKMRFGHVFGGDLYECK